MAPLPSARGQRQCWCRRPVGLGLPRSLVADRCELRRSMATVFGPDSRAWPTTVAQAKNIQLAYCKMRGYSSATCEGVIDEHFKNHSLTQGSDFLTMTPQFCEESVLLLSLDQIHSGSSPANATFLLESSARSTLGGDGQLWPFTTSNCTDTCADGKQMVYHSWSVGCVCAWCETNTWGQVQLCRRKCYVGDSPGCAKCFPSSAAVSVLTPGGAVATRAMEDLRVGDFVQTAGGFSKVFAFMDHASDTEAEYVQLKTASGHELSLTADHMVYAHAEQTPVLAGTITEGDLLWTVPGAGAGFVSSRVVRVRHGPERGMHAPLTEEGSVVVNGVLSSSYAKVKSLRWGSTVLVSGHDLNSLVPRLCGNGWHSAGGRHAWTQLLLDRLGWLQALNDGHSDLHAALVAEPSVFSWLASFAQIGAAVLLSAVFGPASRVTLLTLAAVSLD
ncbi:unnamed protein product [Prorocentrum cordatum]|uniref:Hint domain-containing protein n=1 Tax=Prorocentrum cordatum TaxID=2364126 RepID=A0ABN9UI82_9DINO|nr:unnamed protein product [Polarella glacialis]